MTSLLIIGLFVVSAVLLAYAFLYNSISNNKKSEQRMKSLQTDKQAKVRQQAKRVDDKQRRKARENTLKNVEEQRAAGKKASNPPLRIRLTQAGLDMSLTQFYIVSVILGLIVTIVSLFVLKFPWYIAFGLGLVAGFGLPIWFVNFKRMRRFNKFTLIFPNAIDVVVRGIRSGLPLNDCLRIIASDADEPVRGEFKKIIEATQMGITVPDACARLYENVPTSETNFFAIVIAIQSSAGGNLSEALSNLSKVLRERRKMADKITAFSTEAKTSAMIIGSLPFIVTGLIHARTPTYMVPLFTTPSGHKVLLVCALLMVAGVFIMKKMINFKF